MLPPPPPQYNIYVFLFTLLLSICVDFLAPLDSLSLFFMHHNYAEPNFTSVYIIIIYQLGTQFVVGIIIKVSKLVLYVQEVLANLFSNLPYKMGQDFLDKY